ncbi:MAG: hypothetical protein HY519_02505 [Candidatus Aenigmarchaeota archaeon]|nr:hypothetical protein [Candidatus Aenigmarchaeota archaeon]
MADAPLVEILNLFVFILTDSIDFLLGLLARFAGILDSFGVRLAIGGVPFVIITIVIIGGLVYFLGQYVLGAGRSITTMLVAIIILAFLIMLLL